MTNAMTTTGGADIIERVVIVGDLKELTPPQRVAYYRQVCESVGLNPLTRPLEYITLQGRLTLYARKDATDQLRRIHNVSVAIVARDRIEDVYIVTARATMPDGRTDESTGAVSIGMLKGDALANALMKSETKAKRRVTLSICGLGMLDETEIETIRDAQPTHVDTTTGELPSEAVVGEWKRLRALLKENGEPVRTIKQAAFDVMTANEFSDDITAMTERLAALKAQQSAEAPAGDWKEEYDAVDKAAATTT